MISANNSYRSKYPNTDIGIPEEGSVFQAHSGYSLSVEDHTSTKEWLQSEADARRHLSEMKSELEGKQKVLAVRILTSYNVTRFLRDHVHARSDDHAP